MASARRRVALALAVTSLAWLAAVEPAAATTYTVDKTADTFAGGCTAAPDDCSLRAAIANANSGPGNTVEIPAGRYVLSVASTNEDADVNGDLDVITSTAITGAGAGATIIDAGGIDRAIDFQSNPFGTSSISGVTITGGGSVFDGAGIRQTNGTLNITDSVISGNHIPTASSGGGGIYTAAGTLNVDHTTFSGNTVFNGEAGAIYTGSTVLNITNSTFSGNVVTGIYEGGAIYNQAAMTVTNSTFTGNSTATLGGAIDAEGPTTIVNSSIVGNSAGDKGGGIDVGLSASVQLQNSILSSNIAPTGTNCHVTTGATLTSKGHNIDSGASCGFGAAGDKQYTDPLLGSLADNGGPTQTLALSPGSPAIDAADAAACPAADQRGIARPQLGGCDIGAFEYQDLIAPTVTALSVRPAKLWPYLTGGSVAASASKRRGATVGFTLSEPATVTFTVSRRIAGRKRGKSCKSRAKRGKRCTVLKPLTGNFTVSGAAGANSFKFSGRLNGKKLRPGDYLLIAAAIDPSGNHGVNAQAKFSVRR